MNSKILTDNDIDNRITELLLEYLKAGYVIDGYNQNSNKMVALHKGDDYITIYCNRDNYLSKELSDYVDFRCILVMREKELILKENYYNVGKRRFQSEHYTRDFNHARECIQLINERYIKFRIEDKIIKRYDSKKILAMIKKRKGNSKVKQTDIKKIIAYKKFYEIRFLKGNYESSIKIKKR